MNAHTSPKKASELTARVLVTDETCSEEQSTMAPSQITINAAAAAVAAATTSPWRLLGKTQAATYHIALQH